MHLSAYVKPETSGCHYFLCYVIDLLNRSGRVLSIMNSHILYFHEVFYNLLYVMSTLSIVEGSILTCILEFGGWLVSLATIPHVFLWMYLCICSYEKCDHIHVSYFAIWCLIYKVLITLLSHVSKINIGQTLNFDRFCTP